MTRYPGDDPIMDTPIYRPDSFGGGDEIGSADAPDERSATMMQPADFEDVGSVDAKPQQLPADPRQLLSEDEHRQMNADLATMATQRRRAEVEARGLPVGGSADAKPQRDGWFDTAQSADDDDMDHAEVEELAWAARRAHCGYDDGSGDDGYPSFALIRIDGTWTAVCAFHAQAAAAGEMERNWTVGATDNDAG